MSLRMCSKFGSVLRNVRSSNLMRHIAPGHSSFTIFTSNITTTSVRYDNIPFDPIIDILYEDLLKKANSENPLKTGSKMLSMDAPLESTDINGAPIVPIDINPWMDQEEFDHLMGNSSPMRRKILSMGEMAIQPKREIIRTVDEVIGEKTEPEDKPNDAKVESKDEVKANKTVKKEGEEESDDNVDAEQMIAEALGQRSKRAKDN